MPNVGHSTSDVAAGAVASLAVRKGRSDKLVWQLDPAKCISCGACFDVCGDDAVRYGPKTAAGGTQPAAGGAGA